MELSVLKDAKVPNGCLPCPDCGEMCMEAEGVEDWNGRGWVIRVMSMCNIKLWPGKHGDDYLRTEFARPFDARKEWNSFVVEGYRN